MEYKVYLLRHAETEGNLAHQYIGVTDEPLSQYGIEKLKQLVQNCRYPEVEQVFVSPMLRCRQTMEIIYPEVPSTVISQFAECNFGIFENKTYEDLKDTALYQRWIESGGKGVIPNGEDVDSFKKRCCSGFDLVVRKILESNMENNALIIHGGTIMAILEEYSQDKMDFFHYKAKNGDGFKLVIDSVQWAATKKIKEISKL